MTSRIYRRYLLVLLLIIQIFNAVDRIALGLLLQDIKVDLGLSDTQLGLLTGLAFAFFYSIMGIPIARWADRGNRITIITVTTALWCGAVALTGITRSFTQLLLVRVVVGIGEAGCVPPAQSLIADYFPRTERPRAMAVYMLGVPLSAVVGYLLAGWLNDHFGWRETFVLLSLPGIFLAAIVALTLREPRNEAPAANAAPSKTEPHVPTFGAVAGSLWRNTTFRHLLICWSVVSFFGYGIQQWKPAFFVRTFDLHTANLGLWFAIIYGVSGLLGMPLGGALASRRAALNEALQLKGMALAFCAFGLLSVGIYLSPKPWMAFAFMLLATIGFYTTYGPLFATIQSLVPSRIRAVAVASIYLFANLIGMGLGPLAAGAISDALQPTFGAQSLRYALLILCPGYFWAGWHLWRGSFTVKRDLDAAQASEA